MSKKKLVLLILGGVPASGKSTFRTQFLVDNPDYVCVSRDDFRFMFRNQGWVPNIEVLVTQMVNRAIIAAFDAGFNVISDATHVKEEYLNQYSYLKQLFSVEFQYKYFDIDLETAIERDSKRERSVGREVVEKIHADFEKFKATPRYKQITNPAVKAEATFEPVVQNQTLPHAVIFDIDGTLADMGKDEPGRRGPFEWHRVGEDDLVKVVAEQVHMHDKNGDIIIFLSGRDESCRKQTADWIDKHGLPCDLLFMRPAGNFEKDSIVKHRLFTENVLPRYYTKVIFDDRNQVVETWRQMGLTCFQVAPGDF